MAREEEEQRKTREKEDRDRRMRKREKIFQLLRQREEGKTKIIVHFSPWFIARATSGLISSLKNTPSQLL